MVEREYELLHRFLDGELSPAERQDFERSLAQNSELDGMRKELEDIGRILRTHIEDELADVDFGNFYAGIEAQLPVMAAATGVVDVRAPKVVETSGGLLDGVSSWLSRFWAPALIGGAAAAAIVLFAINRPTQTTVAPQVVVVDSVKIEGTKTVLVMEPVDEEDSTVIWLIDGEKESQEPIDGEDPI